MELVERWTHPGITLQSSFSGKSFNSVCAQIIRTELVNLIGGLFRLRCMLLGHHLRGLENRLHLSCVVGLL